MAARLGSPVNFEIFTGESFQSFSTEKYLFYDEIWQRPGCCTHHRSLHLRNFLPGLPCWVIFSPFGSQRGTYQRLTIRHQSLDDKVWMILKLSCVTSQRTLPVRVPNHIQIAYSTRWISSSEQSTKHLALKFYRLHYSQWSTLLENHLYQNIHN